MTFEPTAWRANDAVTYELAHDALNSLTAALLAHPAAGNPAGADALAEASRVRREFLALDAFDREALDDFLERTTSRLDELRTAKL